MGKAVDGSVHPPASIWGLIRYARPHRGHRASARPYKIGVVSEPNVDAKFFVGPRACARAASGGQTETHRLWALDLAFLARNAAIAPFDKLMIHDKREALHS